MSARDPNLGMRVGGRFLLERTLGAGGVGKVYEALQEDLGRKVAVKLVRSELASEPEVLERFRREARAVAGLAHPHIAQVLAYGEPKGREPAFIAFELVRGTSLAELLHHEGRFTPERTMRLGQQVLAGLAAAHQAGIVHRDLKPGNIFVANVAGVGEMAKLLDFGIAQVHDGQAYKRITATGATVGTPRYMSPEQLTGKIVDARSDLWSLGVVLYRMLAGKPPFDGSPGDILMAIHGSPVPPMPAEAEVPPGLEAVVMRALEKDPDRRWRTAAAMAAALEGALDGAPKPPVALATFDDVTDRVTSPGHAVLPDGTPAAEAEALPIVRPSAHPTLGSVRPGARARKDAQIDASPLPLERGIEDRTLLPRARPSSGVVWAVVAGAVGLAALLAIPLLSSSEPEGTVEPEGTAEVAHTTTPEPPHRTRPDEPAPVDEGDREPATPLPTRGTLRSYLARAVAQAGTGVLTRMEASGVDAESGVIDLSVDGSGLQLDFASEGACNRYVAGPGASERWSLVLECGNGAGIDDLSADVVLVAGQTACERHWRGPVSFSLDGERRVTVSVGDEVAFVADVSAEGAVTVDPSTCARHRSHRPTDPADGEPLRPGIFRPVPPNETSSEVNNPWDGP